MALTQALFAAAPVKLDQFHRFGPKNTADETPVR